MHNEKLDMIIGLIALPLAIVAVYAVVAFGDEPLRPIMHFEVEFDQVGMLKPGAKVKMGSMEIGRVDGVRFHWRKRAGRTIRTVRARVWVYRRYRKQIFANSKAFVASISIIGERHLEIAPPDDKPAREIRDGDVLIGDTPGNLDRLLAMSFASMDQASKTADQLKPHFLKLSVHITLVMDEMKHLRNLDGRIRRTMDAAQQGFRDAEAIWNRVRALIDRAGRMNLVGRAKALYERARRELAPLIEDVRGLVGKARAFFDHLRAKFRPAMDTLRSIMARVQSRTQVMQTFAQLIQRTIERGDGTIGAFIQDKELFDDFKQSGKIIRQQVWRTITRPKKMSVGKHPALP